ncbi:hypothetical protein AN640_08020 [Candidatus Epulonipiscium fishelsonii]|uniref:Uncharacterized protein n=1 Tax=Candidatus Epulonipiscium fishelsonii TaxID=77094 RepID=A0ACC8XE99_9FIRM|nr:hypothetical protein AN640_08020 [Epulopiscium sp. SCG-D08WGA-EpuloA1]
MTMNIIDLPIIGMSLMTMGFVATLGGLIGLAHSKSKYSEETLKIVASSSKNEPFKDYLKNEFPQDEFKMHVEEIPYSSQIQYLLRSGLTLDDVAKQLGKGKGEIQLILSLEEKRRSIK